MHAFSLGTGWPTTRKMDCAHVFFLLASNAQANGLVCIILASNAQANGLVCIKDVFVFVFFHFFCFVVFFKNHPKTDVAFLGGVGWGRVEA